MINAIDRAALVSAMNYSSENSNNDLDGNGIVDFRDRDLLIENIGKTKKMPE